MKFGQELASKRVPAWRHYYVNYTRLKKMVKAMVRDQPGMFQEHFMSELQENMLCVTQFYKRREKELVARTRIRTVGEEDDSHDHSILEEIDELQKFADINVEALRKIAKKYDKMIGQCCNIEERRSKSKLENGPVESDFAPQLPTMLSSRVFTLPPAGHSLQNDLVAEIRLHDISRAKERLQTVRDSLTHKDDEACGLDELRSPLLPKTDSRGSSIFGTTAISQAFAKNWFTRQRSLQAKNKRVLNPMSGVSKYFKAFPKIPKTTICLTIAMTLLSYFASTFRLCEQLNGDSYFTIVLTSIVLYKLMSGTSSDGTLMLATLVLQLAGILTMEEAWSGFSNDVVLSVAVLGIVARGVESTGVVEVIFLKLLGKPTCFSVAMLKLVLPANILNVGVSNTATMAILLPIIDKWAESINISKMMFLMPLSYSLLISGTVAIFGTSSNLVMQGLVKRDRLPPFGNFEIAPVALLSTFTAIIVMLIIVPRLFPLPSPGTDDDDDGDAEKGIVKKPKMGDKKFHISIQIVSTSLDRMPVADAPFIQFLEGGMDDIIRAEHLGDEIPKHELKNLAKFDILCLYTSMQSMIQLARDPTVGILCRASGELLNSFQNDNNTEVRDLVEVVLDGLNPMLKQTLVSSKWKMYNAHVMAIRPLSLTVEIARNPKNREKTLAKYLEDELEKDTAHKLQVGDHLLLDVPSGFHDEYRNTHHFVTVSKVQKRKEDDFDTATTKRNTYHQFISGVILLGMVGSVAFSIEPLLPACMTATFLLVFTGCITTDKAIAAIKVRTVLTIVGAFGLGKAIGKTHVAVVLAQGLSAALMPFGEVGILTAIFAVTVCLGIVFHATAVVILIYPVCISCAEQLHIPIHRILCVLMIGAGCLMLSPVSYQTNLMAFSAGGYDFNDFPKLGLPVVLAIGCVAIPASMYFIHEPVSDTRPF